MGRIRTAIIVTLATLFSTSTIWVTTADARSRRRRVKATTSVNAKALDNLRKPYKWGMSVKGVLKVIHKQLKEKYDEKIQATRDPYVQDNLRKKLRTEFKRIESSLITFDGKNRGWDVSIIDREFAARNGEQMLVIWENQGGKNQRKFFFFFRNKLYKILTAMDMSAIKASQREFTFIQKILERKFGSGQVGYEVNEGIKEPTSISWYTPTLHVRASDKLRFHGTFVLAVASRNLEVACHKSRPPVRKKRTSNILKSMTEDPNKKPDITEGENTIDNLLKNKK